MTVVSFAHIAENFKTAMYEVLSSFFDGNVHRLSDTDIQFPLGKIVFDAHDLRDVSNLTIAIIHSSVLEQNEKRHYNPNTTNKAKHGVEVWASLLEQVVIATPKQGGTNENNFLALTKAWDCLLAVFSAAPAGFTERGIMRPILYPVPTPVTRDTVLELQGNLTAAITCRYAKYNLN